MVEHLYHYRVAEVVSVSDGDSFRAVLDFGFKMRGEKACRLARLDTPELRDADPRVRERAHAARDYLRGRLEGAAGREIVVRSLKLEKYGRALVELYIDGVNINDELLGMGLASPYSS